MNRKKCNLAFGISIILSVSCLFLLLFFPEIPFVDKNEFLIAFIMLCTGVPAIAAFITIGAK